MNLESTNNQITQTLQKVGMDENQSKIYLTLIENGSMLPQHIAQKTGIKRTSLYNLFPEMLAKGYILEVKQGKRRLFTAIKPQKLLDQYQEDFIKTKKLISDLTKIYRIQGIKPEIEVYEGLEGVQKVYLDSLEEKSEILSCHKVSTIKTDMLSWIHNTYIPRRTKLGIKLRSISAFNDLSKNDLFSSSKYSRETRFVPENIFQFQIDTFIYSNKVAFTLCEKDKPLVGIIITSEQISSTQKALFELAWQGAEKYQENNPEKEIKY